MNEKTDASDQEGTHVKARAEPMNDGTDLVKFVLEVYPMPREFTEELFQILGMTIHEWMEIRTGQPVPVEDLSAPPSGELH
jgi:hypothetical protein